MGKKADFVTVVSGLPRSGTSMMMRMLEAGGMPVLTDSLRAPDEDNPLGYYEYDAVKRLRTDTSWVADAVGRAVKIIYLLMYGLPRDQRYRVIFMRRDLREVLASQHVMLLRQRPQAAAENPSAMERLFREHIKRFGEWVITQDNFQVYYADYNSLLRDAVPICDEISDFLDGRVDPKRMASVIDETLYRQRHTSGVIGCTDGDTA